MFMTENMIYVVYVDDTILSGPDASELEKVITRLGIADEEQHHSFELRDEGEVGDFLGIRIEKSSHTQFELTQTGLIEKVLRECEMKDCNPAKTQYYYAFG